MSLRVLQGAGPKMDALKQHTLAQIQLIVGLVVHLERATATAASTSVEVGDGGGTSAEVTRTTPTSDFSETRVWDSQMAAQLRPLSKRTQAVLMASVLQLCTFLFNLGDGSPELFQGWRMDGRPELRQRLLGVSLSGLENGTPGVLLEHHITRLLTCVVTARAQVGPTLERYAWPHDGPLLPSCCHLGCASFYGVGEALLPTLLCGGCRRARYCSTACQRGAWVEGGHRAVCLDVAAVEQRVWDKIMNLKEMFFRQP